ncbi:GTPase [Janibacter sp. GXQ6167]|uniref:GTPase n=1 Tax=Janibacter sp. GXQ6167 TaxID=3240791 RepID=UPI0035256367
MSPLIKGQAKVKAVSGEVLAARAEALRDALWQGGEQLDPLARERAEAVLKKVTERIELVGGHTVVALAGATGSGKSSLFNAVVGAEVARAGAKRPMTSTPTAAIWGEEPASELLDWLGVSNRHRVEGGSASDLDGLVLLDLPDFDSREAAHREESRRVLELADVFVWVTDPQKYADAILHEDYVAALNDYDAVMVAVLNQVDRLSEAGREQCASDLGRLLRADGIANPQVISTSVKDGTGIDELHHRLHVAVSSAEAARHRLAADLTTTARELKRSVGGTEADIDQRSEQELVVALARAAGVPTVVDAVRRDFVMEALAQTGWPFSRWMRAFKPAPLKRLRLDKTGEAPDFTEADIRAVLGRSSLPPPTPAARAAVDLATRRVGEQSSEWLPSRWADAVADAAVPSADDLGDSLDQAVVRTPLRDKRPMWWTVVGLLQNLFALAVIVGAVWLIAAAVVAWLQLPPLPTAKVGPFATPLLLVAGGLILGLVLAAVARAAARAGAKRRAALIERRLHESIREVADERVLDPVRGVLTRHANTRHLLEQARG